MDLPSQMILFAEANSADAIYHAALAGVGIARLSTYLIHDDLRTGTARAPSAGVFPGGLQHRRDLFRTPQSRAENSRLSRLPCRPFRAGAGLGAGLGAAPVTRVATVPVLSCGA